MAEAALAALRACLVVCELSEDQREALTGAQGEGFLSLESFGRTTEKQMVAMLKQLGMRRPQENAVYYGMVATRNLCALAWWIRDQSRRDFAIEQERWTVEKLNETLESMEYSTKENEKGTLPDLPKMQIGTGFQQWDIEVQNKFMSMTGVTGVPLAYVIRPELPEDHDGVFENDTIELINQAPLEGPAFETDMKTVHQLLKTAVLGTNGWTWFRKADRGENGRKGYLALCNHYNGPGVVETMIAEAKSLIKSTSYKDEHRFTMEQVVTNLRKGYTTLREKECPLSERDEVETFLGKINNGHIDIRTAVSQIRTDPAMRNNFEAAANYMLERVAITFPDNGSARQDTSNRYHRKRKLADVNRGGRGGRGRGRGDQGGRGGRSGRGGGRGRGRGGGRGGGRGRGGGGYQAQDYSNTPTVNGIDITDVTRTFSGAEWNALPAACTSWIHEERTRVNGLVQRQVGATSVQWMLPPMVQQPNQAQVAAMNQTSQIATAGTTMQVVPGNAGNSFGSVSYGQPGTAANTATVNNGPNR
jgi:hypothetical protein